MMLLVSVLDSFCDQLFRGNMITLSFKDDECTSDELEVTNDEFLKENMVDLESDYTIDDEELGEALPDTF
ncbi:hypothetical protein L2E82_27171 [Cichorium intybus]|uniref:Uncharacterized protein n=1 Tax=Cichorium intybus TaxID=13427 RepID=A0ACB9CSD0_CICIN|nr:hypothetical protein L2E82_27171 [Cichorium intybus]